MTRKFSADMPDEKAVMESLANKQAQVAQLQKQLESSLLIQEIMPDAFKYGSIKIGAQATVQEPHKGMITFRLGNGEVRLRPAMLVPFSLWPVGLKEDFEAMPEYRKKPIRGKLL